MPICPAGKGQRTPGTLGEMCFQIPLLPVAARQVVMGERNRVPRQTSVFDQIPQKQTLRWGFMYSNLSKNDSQGKEVMERERDRKAGKERVPS